MTWIDVVVIGVLAVAVVASVSALVLGLRMQGNVHQRQQLKTMTRKSTQDHIEHRPYFQIAGKRLAELYRQAQFEQPAQKREVQDVRTVRGEGSIKPSPLSISAGAERQVTENASFLGEETSPSRQAAELERRLEENGEVRKIDLTSEEPIQHLLEKIRHDLRGSGLDLTDGIRKAITNEWASGGGLPSTGTLRGFVQLRANFVIDLEPPEDRENRLILSVVKSDLPSSTPITVTAMRSEILEDSHADLRAGRQIAATVFGYVITSAPNDDPRITLRAVYSYW